MYEAKLKHQFYDKFKIYGLLLSKWGSKYGRSICKVIE